MPHLSIKYDQKARGSTFRKLGGGMRHASWNPYPISHQNLWFSLPYFRPDQKFDALLRTWSPGARRATWARDKLLRHAHVHVGVDIKREMVLSPNDEEVASSKENTQFKSRLHKPHPISHPIWRHTYLYSLYKEIPPPPRPNEKRIADYESSCLRKRD